jgi:oligoribonuclease NrnB/cAMP/cGMP phosphodiesterase (DHH superfamily)
MLFTHNDFDGLVSAALLSWAYDVDDIVFTGPISVSKAEVQITKDDIVSDLPYPLECGMWFDHHAGNLVEVKLRGIDPATIPGRFEIAPSCVRVVYDYLKEHFPDIPEDYAELADVSDVIDSFSYASLDDWRADTPANRIDRALKASSENRRAHEDFLRELTFMFRDLPLGEIAEDAMIKTRAESYAKAELLMLEHIQKYGKSIPEDAHGELIFVDTTSFVNSARIDKKLIGLIHPHAKGYVELKPLFRSGQKTLDITVTLSLALNMQQAPHKKDMSEIVRELNIGDGHAGAAAGVWKCKSGSDYQKMREELPKKILSLWRGM